MKGEYYSFPVNMKPLRWKKNMLFTGVRNDTLFDATEGGFPVTSGDDSRKTHPIFVLGFEDGKTRDESGFLRYPVAGPIVCPGSTKNWNDKPDRRYLRSGAVTSNKKIIQADTYLVEEHSFVVPRNLAYHEEFEEKYTNARCPQNKPLYCMGVVRKEDIIKGMWYVR